MQKDCLFWQYNFLKLFGVCFLLLFVFLQLVYTDQHDFISVDSPQNFYEDQLSAKRMTIGILGDDKPATIFSRSYIHGDHLFLFATHGYQFENGKLEEEVILYTSLDQGETWSERQTLPILGGRPQTSITKRGTILITTRLLAEDIRNALGYTHSYLYRSTNNLKTIEQIQINAEISPQIVTEVPKNVGPNSRTTQDKINLRNELLPTATNKNSKSKKTLVDRTKPTQVDLEELSNPDELALESTRSNRRKRGIGTSRELMELIGERKRIAGSLPERVRQKWVSTSRNVLELTNGSLILGVTMPNGINYLWESSNEGKTWDVTTQCNFEGIDPNRVNYPFLDQGVFWQPTNRDLLLLVSVTSDLFPVKNSQLLATDLNQSEKLVIFRSRDLGRNWRKEKELGTDYGVMYPELIRLHHGGLLMTFTVMDFKQPLGLWAILGRERPFGFDFNFRYDRLILSRRTPEKQNVNTGFGSTQQLKDSKFITFYSYKGINKKTRLEIVKWSLSPTSRITMGF